MEVANSRLATTVALLVLLAVLVYGQTNGTPAQSREAVDRTTEVCVAVNEVKRGFVLYIEKQLGRAKKSLPTIDYYRKHPVELGKQLSVIDRQLEDARETFAVDSCE